MVHASVCVWEHAYIGIHVNCSIVQSTTHNSNVKAFTLKSPSLEDCAVGIGLFDNSQLGG